MCAILIGVAYGSIAYFAGSKHDDTVYETSSNIQIDVKLYKDSIDSLQNVINDIQLDIYKYETYTDSIADELLVAQYKLERVKYYNSIATGTNLKYLRGWLNRVLEE